MLTSPLYFQVKSSSASFRLPIVASLTWKTRLATTMTKMETSVILLGLKLDPAPPLLPPLQCRFELSLQPFSSSQLWSQATGYQFRIITIASPSPAAVQASLETDKKKLEMRWVFTDHPFLDMVLWDFKLFYMNYFNKRYYKVHIFWEGHKILRNLFLTFVLCTASQK